MALAAISDDFDLDDCGILRDSVTSAELLIDDDGILQDDINIFKHMVRTGGQGTDSGFGGDKQSSTSTIQHLQASFDEDLAPIGDESINISDFEASRDDLDSIGGDLDGHREGKSRSYHKSKNLSLEVDTPQSTLEHPQDFKREALPQQKLWGKKENMNKDKNLFTDDYYQQLRELGVLVEGADFSKDESFNESEMLEGQMSQEPVDYDDHRDLIGEYLQEQYDRELAEQEETESLNRMKTYEMSEAQVGRHSRASSAPTISGRSFPEISPEDAAVILSESQQTENEDEIFLINNQLLPASRLQAQKLPVTPPTQSSHPGSRTGSRPGSRSGSHPESRTGSRPGSRTGSRPGSRTGSHLSGVGSQLNTPQGIDIRGGGSLRQTLQNHLQHPSSRQSHSPDTSHLEMPFSHEEQEVSWSETNTPHRRRTDSMTSENMSTGSPSKSTISKARSQESFFELDRQQAVSAEKGHKRLLPTPSMSDANESFKIKSKSKSVSNIFQRSGPVKPTHMSISEIDRMTTEEGGIRIGEQSDEMLKKLEGELSTQLKQESVRRKQATELVQQLQKEYDMLLSKYALAELTIDQMRLGARITLHANSPTPISTHAGIVSSGTGAHKGQIMQMAPPPVQKAVVDHFSPVPANTVLLPKSGGSKNNDQHTSSGSQTEKPMTFGSAAIGVGEDSSRPGEPAFRSENRVANRTSVPPETVKLNLQTQAASLDDRLSHFYTLLEEQHLTLEEQEQVFDNIRTDHDKLRRAYLQAKEDYNVLRRSGASLPNTEFDASKELEGQLFRLGMKFDEIHERVDSNLKEKSMRRHPFQANRHADDDDSDQGNNADNQDINRGSEQAKDGMQTALSESETGDDQEFEKRAQFLHDEYKALMDRYRRLKQMSETPEREKETDSLVRKLKDICNEMPDMFRLPPELQKRFKEWKKNERLRLYYQMNSVWERLQMRDQRRSPILSSMTQQQKQQQQQQRKTGDGVVGGTIPSREIGGSRRMSPVPRGLGTPVLGDHTVNAYGLNQHGGRDINGEDNFRRPPSSLAGSHSSMASPRDIDSAAGHSSAPFSPHHRELLSPSSVDGAAAPRDKESYDPRMPRPHQHKHGFHDPKLTKLPDRGSYSSLPDSGISDQEQQTKDRHHNDALANLPGPGKFKQMTRQRGADDVDSGFVGSVVGSEVLQNQSHDQAERPLRLQDRRSDQNPNRSFLDSSGSTSTIATSTRSSRRSSLKQELPSKHSSSTATGIVSRSVSRSTDQSYDGELDESTVSEVRAQVLQPRDVPPKERPSVNLLKLQLSEAVPGHKSKGKDESGEESQSVQESTFEDTKNEETEEDFSTSGPEESAGRVFKSVEITTEQHTQATQHELASLCPPTPRRPPTPYQTEQSQENQVEDADQMRSGLQQQKVHPSKTLKSHVSSNNELHSMSKLRQVHGSQTPSVQMQQDQRRPQSRGEPTTDLYHTRGQRGHNRDKTKVISDQTRGSSYEGKQENQRPDSRAEDHGMSTDTDVRSDATRGSSVNSSRLRALQEEIERLKEGVKQANEKASNPPQFPPPPSSPERQDPEYYDPFDDPYGFMRMPRRRANSFSGGRVRDYDEWYWTLPNERRNEDGDIPLGYAAADSYNRRAHGQRDTHEAPHRLKHRVPRRRASYMQAKTVDADGGGGECEAAPGLTSEPAAQGAAPSQTARSMPLRGHPPPPHITDPQALFNYYVPTRNNVQSAYMPSATKTKNTAPLSSSQTNMADVHASAVTYQPQGRASDSQQRLRKQPWYTIRRAPKPLSGGEYVAAYSHMPARPEYQQAATSQSYIAPNTYYAAYPVVGGVAQAHGAVGQSYWTEACPLCGGAGGHIHEEDVEPVYGYAADDFATEGEYRGRTRQRSKSRSKRHTPERDFLQNQYLVREYRETASDDSDLEEAAFHRRNRSKSRSRSHSETRSSSRHRHSRRYRRRRDQSPDLLDSDENVDLNESLILSEDISRLTKRMLGTVHGELVKARNKPDFGSSYW